MDAATLKHRSALELMYNDQDDNDCCEGFLYEDIYWKLIREYAREE